MNPDANREISLPGDAISPLTSPGTIKVPPIAVPALLSLIHI